MNSMYYNNLSTNHSKINQNLFDVNKQIASGLKIQYASDDVATFVETMRLDNELTTLGQVKKSTDAGYKVSDHTDATLNEFDEELVRMKTLFIQAGNDTNDEISLDAIAKELRGIEGTLKSLANTSINGKYLFSGSAIDTKPISDDGSYNGNDTSLEALVGSKNRQSYNITGAELFLGEESWVSRKITTNVVNKNLLKDYPAFQVSPSDFEPLTSSSSIRNLMGDTDGDLIPENKHYFYLRGAKSDGESIKEKIEMSDSDTVGSLLSKIGSVYGNNGSVNVVNVSMNASGQIIIEDKLNGSSKLDFHMVGAVDFSGGVGADVTDIDLLNAGDTNFDNVIATLPAGLFVKEFVKSNLTSSDGGGVPADEVTLMQGAVYDRTEFSINGSTLSSSTPQVLKGTNEFATNSTKLSEVADLSQNNIDTLDGTTFKFAGTNINGQDYNALINLNSAGSTFSVGGSTYDIFNMDTTRVATDADEVTYQQLMDVMNMVMTDNLPATSPGTDTEYDDAIENASFSGSTFLSYDGKIQFEDINATNTKATISLYDSSSDGFTTDLLTGEVTSPSSVMTFNTNNALTIRDPKTDFFKTINDAIKSVEEYKRYPNTSSGDMRNIGMENALGMLDDLHKHLLKTHSTAGAQSNALSTYLQNTEVLELSTMTLRSEVIDTDLAEAALRLQQLTLNQQAMLSTVGKVAKLSLVNYL